MLVILTKVSTIFAIPQKIIFEVGLYIAVCVIVQYKQYEKKKEKNLSQSQAAWLQKIKLFASKTK